ncbi:GNAT family N-acetyltransferase [Devosia sp. Root635]|uniref:GNAT family N-acetyltransferase n=1 Tax=Devosia sp. Root635 TaxID=1736575 RepID=UPI0007016EFF|nr:GNAT family N-acetyltransferase [Devosia sp. Root635]KRA51476.1 acetyltransferase [Devosia sp. Root635]
MPLTLAATAAPTADELATIGDNLTHFNEADVGPADRQPLAVLLRDDAGPILGGLSGYTAWGWLYIQWLWLSEAQRGQGWSTRLLTAAEAEARHRACHGAYIDTFNPVALKVYQRAGYTPFGSLPDFPKGRTRTFLQKVL